MEKLNEYLQSLLSTCSYELHLEPNKNPYLVSSTGQTDVANSPLLGTQISMMIFPIIPTDVKQQLPDRNEVHFVHPHVLGKFNFSVKKSPAGFIVTVIPMLSDAPPVAAVKQEPGAIFQPIPAAQLHEFESASLDYSKNYDSFAQTSILPEIETAFSAPAPEFYGQMIPDIVSVNDPQFTTEFSDTSTYEPPGRRDDFAPVGQVSSAPPIVAPDLEPTNTASNQMNNSFQPIQPTAPPQFTPPSIEITEPPVAAAFAEARANPQAQARMNALFHKMAQVGASDLHLSVSMPPLVRKDGKIMQFECGETTLTPDTMRELLTSIMPARNQEEFAGRSDSDFAYEIPGLARFRANIFADRKGMGGVFRIIPTKILTAEQLGLSKAVMDLCSLSKGLVVVTGPTGSGKSTTLCAMVDSINKNREDHIITIEDPIEFTHENQRCLVNQREVHNHTDSFKDALRAALREDPDILLVGEMRDLETISIAIETAETGHLVFGTLHTTTAASTVDRIIDQFPADRQQQIRVMLSESLKGVIAQTLLPKIGGGRVAALEILIVTPAISNLIREGKTFQIASSMQTGKQHGMVMLNDALFEHVKSGLVAPRDAYIKAVDKANFETLLTRNGFKL